MDELKHEVYIKTNENGYITAVNSSEFLIYTLDWIKIDEGHGDKYHHAQNNYFPKPIVTDSCVYQYKMKDGLPVECSKEEIAEQEKDILVPEEPETESSVWDELDTAYQEGVDSV